MPRRLFKVTDVRKGCSFKLWADSRRFAMTKLWLSVAAGGFGIPLAEVKFYRIEEITVSLAVCG